MIFLINPNQQDVSNQLSIIRRDARAYILPMSKQNQLIKQSLAHVHIHRPTCKCRYAASDGNLTGQISGKFYGEDVAIVGSIETIVHFPMMKVADLFDDGKSQSVAPGILSWIGETSEKCFVLKR